VEEEEERRKLLEERGLGEIGEGDGRWHVSPKSEALR
jgi:hypothetical protein